MNVQIEPSWKAALGGEFKKPYFKELTSFVRNEYLTTTVYPPSELLFRAFELAPFEKVKVVILGQDPYHGPDQAHGLCFSVQKGIRVPRSLENIYSEIESDLGQAVGNKEAKSGNLEHWAKQGVLLLNATLTVRAHQPGSHQRQGWEKFTDAVIRTLSDGKENLVFILWGRYAQEKGGVIDQEKHLVLKASHPSPFSAHSGFFGCKHFSKTNKYLESKNLQPIKWVPSSP